MGRLAGKVAIVTGASRGIGAAIAKRLAAEGASVMVNYNRNSDAALQVVADILAMHDKAIEVKADMADLEQVQRMFDDAMLQYGRLDILVNNAGVAEFHPLGEITQQEYERQFDVNVRGVLFASQEAAKRFGEEGGRIINITSGAAQACPPGTSVYSATKAAVEAMTKSHAAELGPRSITVNAVAPGFTETDMLAAVFPADARESMIARTPLGRIGTPEDIADVVAFLASDDARWITGQVLGVNGGLR
jgi:3-oxoacyl-[acyl-carrier protein] reductase